MDMKLKNRLALVSGSTAGIGYAIAVGLAAEGARVIVNGRTQAAVDAAVSTIRSATGSDVLGFAGDLATADAAEALVRENPGIEILVNNLGIFEPRPFAEIPDTDWMRFFATNVLSGVRLARLCLPAMRRADWGRIIFISSESGVQIPAEMIHYGVTKTAQLAVSRGLAESLAGTGITVNSILPGPTRSRGGERLRRGAGRGAGTIVRRIREGLLCPGPTDVPDPALRDSRRGGVAGDLYREPARFGNHRRRAARRWRGDQERLLSGSFT
jgi:NAD(P)-dependent dehydrogenase (short-subunit alcohol dehydrogenase family)